MQDNMKNLEPTTEKVTRHCPVCNDEKLFNVFIHKGISKRKMRNAIFTIGISLAFEGITGERVYICSNCSHAEEE